MSKRHHILIIDEVHPILLDKLAEHDVTYLPSISIGDLEENLSGVTILVLRSKLVFDKSWIDKADTLEFIGRLGSGMDNIDVTYAKTKGIECMNAPEGNRNAVAEQTVGMILGMLSNIYKATNEVQMGLWDRKGNQGVELKNMTVGIIGYGNVGSTLANKLSSFGCKVVAYDKFVKSFGNSIVEEVSLEELQVESDIITLHVPLNRYSKEMVDSTFIEKVCKPFFLLNLARGEVVNIVDVISGLRSGKIKGAALDVLPNEKLNKLSVKEKLEFDFLTDNERVIITPHIGGLTKDSYLGLANVLAEKIINWVNINPLVN
ncbi:MAG: phosphoglycerate dehydrogenase [Bacteroidetes bacterium]|nr:MAG: phosphoglycerate dehydrogenase [Bacteroidota bacterium]